MRYYKCAYCGRKFSEDETDTRTEHEEFWGAPCTIEYEVCPGCAEDISDEDEISEEEYENDD